MAWIDGVGSCTFSGLVISQNKPVSVPNKVVWLFFVF